MLGRPSLSSILVIGCVVAAVVAVPTTASADETPAPTDPFLEPPVTPEDFALPTVARVHIASESIVKLQHRPPGHGAWAFACQSPCDRNLPLSDEYRVVYGKDIDAGETLRLDGALGSAVTLKVHPASQAQEVGGIVIAVVGVGLASVGAVGVVVGALAVNAASSGRGGYEGGTSDCTVCGSGLGTLIVVVSGAILVAGGLTITGGVLLANHAGSSTTQEPTFVREVTWVAPRAAAPAMPLFVVPLSFSF